MRISFAPVQFMSDLRFFPLVSLLVLQHAFHWVVLKSVSASLSPVHIDAHARVQKADWDGFSVKRARRDDIRLQKG